MKRKLLLLNLLLVALIAWGAMRIRRMVLEGRAGEQVVLGKQVQPAPPLKQPKLPPAQPLAATEYIEIAQKMLFSKDRNPTVVVEEAAPAPKPMPALPVIHGMMAFPDGPMVILSEKAGSRHQGYRIGERIGEFTLAGVNSREISFEWDGQTITRPVTDLQDHGSQAASETVARTANPQAAPPSPAGPRGQPAPGLPVDEKIRACQPGDDSPAGTVADGMRKVITETPFGKSCRWEPN